MATLSKLYLPNRFLILKIDTFIQKERAERLQCFKISPSRAFADLKKFHILRAKEKKKPKKKASKFGAAVPDK